MARTSTQQLQDLARLLNQIAESPQLRAMLIGAEEAGRAVMPAVQFVITIRDQVEEAIQAIQEQQRAVQEAQRILAPEVPASTTTMPAWVQDGPMPLFIAWLEGPSEGDF